MPDVWHDVERSSAGQAVIQAVSTIVGTICGRPLGAVPVAGTISYAFTGELQSACLAEATALVTAAAFSGAEEIMPANASPITQASIHAGAGGATGGVNAALSGGNLGLGVLTGGISGGVGSYLRASLRLDRK